MKWIKVLRLPILSVGALLAILGFRMSGTEISWLPILSGVVIGSAAMAQNDWRDRFNDARKGKTLALQHPQRFLSFVLALWFASTSLTVLVWRVNANMATLLFGLIAVGLFYSEFRRVLVLPNIVVATASASSALFPVAFLRISPQVWLLFLGAFLVIFGREIVKDIQDLSTDDNHKWTLPLKFGERISRTMATALIIGAVTICLTLSLATIIGALSLLSSAGYLFSGRSVKTARLFLDAALATVLTLLFVV